MNADKELADELVELGVLYSDGNGLYSMDEPPAHPYCWMLPQIAVRDWRVVGAMIAKCLNKPDWMSINVDRKVSSETMHRCWIERTHSGDEVEIYHARNESLPRAINEAAAEALS